MRKTQMYFIFALFFALMAAVFAVQNPERIDINILFWKLTGVSKVMVILASTALGALVAFLLGLGGQFKRFMYIRRLESEIKELKKQTPADISGRG